MIVATLASLASREQLLARTVASLLPQVDAICVYLNGYARVPECLRVPKILHAVLSVEAGWRGAEAKLWFWDRSEFKAAPAWDDDDIAVVCDDDLIYPTDYVSKMCRALVERPGTVACVHGSVMMEPFERYATSRMVARTVHKLDRDTQVHIPGTGTMAFRVGDLSPRLSIKEAFGWSHAVDPHVAVLCKELGLPVWSVARPPAWVKTQEMPKEGMAIFVSRTGVANDSAETALLKSAGPWPRLVHAHDMLPRGAQVSQGALARTKHAKVYEIPTPSANAMLPPEAFAWMESRLELAAGGVVVELGSGHGTQKLLDQVAGAGGTLVSVEHDAKFVGLVDGAHYIHAPIHNGWYDARTLKAKLPPREQIAAVIVDGPPGIIGRARLLKNLDLFPERVPMLIDDVHRAPELQLAKSIAHERGELLQMHPCRGRAFATLGWS